MKAFALRNRTRIVNATCLVTTPPATLELHQTAIGVILCRSAPKLRRIRLALAAACLMMRVTQLWDIVLGARS